jgi:glycosyltransferase involved in cell wall biosynthesis
VHKPHRILYIHHGKGIGGAPLSLLYLIRQIDRAQYEPVVLCLYESSAADLYRDAGVETHIARGIRTFDHSTLLWYNLRRPWRLPWRLLTFWPSVKNTRRAVMALQPDLVHLNSAQLAPSAIGAHQAGVPVVWHVREQIASGYLGIRQRWLKRAIARYGDRVIAICQNDADQLMQNGRVRVVYNFVDFDQFDRHLEPGAIRQELGLGSERRLVVMLGGVNPAKGTWEFVRALPRVLQRIPGAHFLVLGHFPGFRDNRGIKAALVRALYGYQHKIERFIRQQDLAAHITFTGARRDVPQVMAATDVIVFPSTVPHFARPIIEAGAMAKPVVASDLGGPRELVVDGETGFLVPPSDPKALADAMVRILSDDDLARRMGETGYQRARQLFDAKVNAQQTVAVYEELFAERGA